MRFPFGKRHYDIWVRAYTERNKQNLSDMKEQLKELRYIADVLDGTAHTRKATHELKAVERQSKGKLGKKTREDQAQKAIAAIVMSP